jgi:hypothetical protein
MIAKVTKRTELGPLVALSAARHARVERPNRFCPVWGRAAHGHARRRAGSSVSFRLGVVCSDSAARQPSA